MQDKTGAAITGWGTALPDRVVTNHDLELRLDTNDAWIVERTGIRERRIGGTTASLGTAAGREAIARAGLESSDIDLVILATTTPDRIMPATASTIQHDLGIRGGAMDVNVACSGFIYAAEMAHAMVQTNMHHILVVGSDTLSRVTDQEDRSTAVLFADGAGAVVVSATDGRDQLLASELGSDGSLLGIVNAETGGHIYMSGKEVYRQAVTICVESIQQVCKSAGVEASDIDLFVPHQANVRIIEAICERLDIPMSRAAVVLDRTGNTSSASVPLALDHAIRSDMVKSQDLVLFCGFGAGMSWATQIWRWGT